MTYPMPRDNVFLDPSGAVTTAPGEAYRNEHDQSEKLYEETAHAEAAEESDAGEVEAREEEARAAEGDEDDDAEISDDAESRPVAEADDDDEEYDEDDADETADDAEDVAVSEDDEVVDVDHGELPDEGDAEDADEAAAYEPAAVDETMIDGETVDGETVAENHDVDVTPVGIPQQVTVSDPVLADEPADDGATEDVAAEDGVAVGVAAVASGMHPGDADVPVAAAALANSADFHDRWQQAQLSFIDDPRAAAESARTLAAEVLEAHIGALRDRQEQLDAWQSEATPDTEVLRAAMRAYRDMVTSLTEE